MLAESLTFALLVTLMVSILTLMTGFGIGTILTPTFTLFYDIKTAVFLVAVVHLANNLLKVGLFMKHLDKKIFRRFGLVSLTGAVIGSLLYGAVNQALLKDFLGVFLITVGVNEMRRSEKTWRIPQRFDYLGGFFSGLMGGLIGNQGAIRSAYLLNYELSKEAFVATAASIAILIDLSRIPLYLARQSGQFQQVGWSLVGVMLVAFAGTLIGKRLLTRLSLERFRSLIAAFIVVAGILMFV